MNAALCYMIIMGCGRNCHCKQLPLEFPMKVWEYLDYYYYLIPFILAQAVVWEEVMRVYAYA